VGVALPVTDGGIVVAGVAGNVRHRLPRRNITTALADDHRQLTFVIQLRGYLRTHDRLAAPQLGIGEASEHSGVSALFAAGLEAVHLVVESDA